MKTPGLPRALLVVGGLALAIVAGIGTAGSFGGNGNLWGDQYDPDAGSAEARATETTLRGPAIRATLDSMSAAFMEALENGDHETLAGFYADGAIYFPAMGSPVRGRDALRAHFREDLPDLSSVDVRERQVMVLSPEWATEHATVVLREDAEGGSPSTELSYSLLYHRTDAGWRIIRDIASANAPPSGAP